MLFYSNIYIFFFLPILLITYYLIFKDNNNLKKIIILFSIVFYAWWNVIYLPLIIIIIIINYNFGNLIIRSLNSKKTLLILAVFINILNLFTFKYLNFFIENFNIIFNLNLKSIGLEFPLGISFYTFQIITYLSDCYYGNIKKSKFFDFFLFVIFFPQLVAGPIIRFNFLMAQFTDKINNFNINNIFNGLILFFIGFIKKVYLSNQLSKFVDNGFANFNNLTLIDSWFTSISFSFQFYFDFSGYVDMALGSALLLNLKLPINFNSPFKAHNLINFWQRWHITLSNFIMNYMYFPLLKNYKISNFYFSLSLTILIFSIIGFWHGPSWMFIIFGIFHGVGVVFNHLLNRFTNFSFPKIFSILLIFLYVNFTFIFFRSENIFQSNKIIYNMFNFNNLGNFDYDITFLMFFTISFILIFFTKNSNEIINYLTSKNSLNDQR